MFICCFSLQPHVSRRVIAVACDGRSEAAEPMALLEAVMEGLVDARSGTLRALCASLCAEWLNWSDKHVRHAPRPASQSPCSPRP